MIDPVQSFSAMLRETLGDRLKPGAEPSSRWWRRTG